MERTEVLQLLKRKLLKAQETMKLIADKKKGCSPIQGRGFGVC
jgi:hypothetical protein